MFNLLFPLIYDLFLQVPLKKESGQAVLVPLFQSQENISGKVYCLITLFSMLSIIVCEGKHFGN